MTARNEPPPPWLTAEPDLDLPASKVEARLQKQVLKLVRTLESRTRGLYAEVLIAETLGEGAELGHHVMSPWDVRWRDIEIAVRTTGRVNSYSYEERTVACGWTFNKGGAYLDGSDRLTAETRRCWADVAVLAHHEGTDIAAGWSFYALPAKRLNERSAKSVSVAAARRLTESVGTGGLAAAVQRAAHER